ncbi:hypothetical protein D918_09945 [Trichuris suis]|nr:hypothetical protein D918_09945 [Trichuris suis]
MGKSEKVKGSANDTSAKFAGISASAAELFCNAKNKQSNLLESHAAFAKNTLLLDEIVYLFGNITTCDRFRKLLELCELLDIHELSKCRILAKMSEVLGDAHVSEQQQQRDRNVSMLLQRYVERDKVVFTGLKQVDGNDLSQWPCIEGALTNVAGLSYHRLRDPVMAMDDGKYVSNVLKQIASEKGKVAKLKKELGFVSDVLKQYEDFPSNYDEAKAVVESYRKRVMEIKDGVLSGRF